MTAAYQINNLQFNYGNLTALSIKRLLINPCKITALVGPNGCGKSTLLNVLALLQAPTNGEIIFYGQTVNPEKMATLRKRIAFLPQKPYLFRGSVEDNLTLTLKFNGVAKNQHQANIKQALKIFDIEHLRHQPAKTLSGGELQKTALIRAILTNPQVLLLDEPFSYLDHDSEQSLQQFICDYSHENDKTLIFSTHNRLQGLSIASEVISLINGRPVNTPLINVYHGYLEKQLFNTGKIQIYLPDAPHQGRHVSIDPQEIVLSKHPLISSMRNQFQGKITAIAEENKNIRITINAGEIFQAIITHNALKDLNLVLGNKIWVNFKSNTVTIF